MSGAFSRVCLVMCVTFSEGLLWFGLWFGALGRFASKRVHSIHLPCAALVAGVFQLNLLFDLITVHISEDIISARQRRLFFRPITPYLCTMLATGCPGRMPAVAILDWINGRFIITCNHSVALTRVYRVVSFVTACSQISKCTAYCIVQRIVLMTVSVELIDFTIPIQ